MKFIITMITILCLSGCVSQSEYEVRKTQLVQDIEILKLEVRKEYLENTLEALERN